MDTKLTYTIIFACFFIIIFSVSYFLTTTERKKEKNLELLTIHTPENEHADEPKDTEDFLHKIYNKYYNQKFIQANFRLTYKEFKTYAYTAVGCTIISTIIVSIIFSILFGIAFAGFIAFVLFKLPDMIIENKKNKRKLALNAQKSDILSIMSSCSSSKMSLDKTFQTLSKRLKEPANEIFYEAYSLMQVGNTAEEVLRHLKKVFDSNDFNFLLSSYEVWLENQGSLQDTYKIVSISIRDKEEIDLHMNGVIANTKSTIIVLIAISILFVVLSLAMIAEIFIPFAKSFLGQASIISSFFILFWGINAVNKAKNSVKY